jgi:hypothetical protein
MGDDCAIVEISALRPLDVTRHLSKNDAEAGLSSKPRQIGIFLGSRVVGCESRFAECRESLLFGAGIYAQAERKLVNWLNMLGRRGAANRSQSDG